MNEDMAPMSYPAKVPHVLNLSNGIIGVSILAMPFCMKQCGLLLGTIVLIITAMLTRLSCQLLMKGAHFARSHSYESYALQACGPLGKTAVEIFMILYTKGTLIAFFVIIGDLGPLILSDFVGDSIVNEAKDGSKETLRIMFMAAVALFIILPLSLLRSLGSLSRISSLAILFYGFLVVRIFVQSLPSFFSTKWWTEVNWWQPSGFLQTLPIFALSLSCQTQLFIMASEMPDWSPAKMDGIVDSALNLCSGIYLMVGAFGYIAFHKQPFGGDVLVLLDNNGLTKLIKAGFLLSLAVSYPIMIFPCRSAIYSMFFRRSSVSLGVEYVNDTHMPSTPLRAITVYLIAFNLLIAIWVPDVELILALCGSLVGSLICFVMPGLLFYRVSPTRDTYSRFLAQLCVAVGLFTLVFSTYVSLREAKAAEGHSKATLSNLANSAVPGQEPVYLQPAPLPDVEVPQKRAVDAGNPLPSIDPNDLNAHAEVLVQQPLKQQVKQRKKIEEQQKIIEEMKKEQAHKVAEKPDHQKFEGDTVNVQRLSELTAPTSTGTGTVPRVNGSNNVVRKEV